MNAIDMKTYNVGVIDEYEAASGREVPVVVLTPESADG